MDYVTWHFDCPSCGNMYNMHERDYDKIPYVIANEVKCWHEVGYGPKKRKCGFMFTPTKDTLYSIQYRSWPELEAFVEGLYRGDKD